MGFDKQADTLIAHYEEQGKAQADAYKQQVLGEVAKAKHDLAAIQERCQGQLAESESQLNSLREEISQAQQTYGDIQNRITEARATFDTLRSTQASVTLDIEAAEQAGQKKLAESEERFAKVCASMDEELAQKQKQIFDATNQLQEINNSISYRESILVEQAQQLNAAAEKIHEAEIEFANLTENIVTAKGDLDAVAQKGVAVREELARTETQLQEKQGQILELDAQMLSLNSEIEQIAKDQAANTALSKSLAERENEVKVQEKALAARRVELAKKEQDIKAAQAAIAEL